MPPTHPASRRQRRENAGKEVARLMCRQRENVRARASREGKHAVGGGGVVSRGLVGRLQPRFYATPCIPPPRRPPARRSASPISFCPSIARVRRSAFLCFSAFSREKTALKRYRKIITGKAFHTRVRRTAGPTDGITLILVSFGPTD